MATFLHRLPIVFPIIMLVAIAVVPYIKPLLIPIPDKWFSESWKGDACLQSTPSTCGPASVCNSLKQLGTMRSEKEIARAAYSYGGGTEAWYLARYLRREGFAVRFKFEPNFSAVVGFPAVVGVRLGGAGHFIAVLESTPDGVVYVDPLYGKASVSQSDFLKRYQFTGFHMVISKL